MTDRLVRCPDADVHVPSVGSTKAPFSWCRYHILVLDYRWGSIGSDETAITISGALEKLTFFTGTGRHRAQIIYLFRTQIGSRTPSGIGLRSGSRLDRMRRFLELSGELWIQNFGGIMVVVRALLGTCTDMHPLLEALVHAA